MERKLTRDVSAFQICHHHSYIIQEALKHETLGQSYCILQIKYQKRSDFSMHEEHTNRALFHHGKKQLGPLTSWKTREKILDFAISATNFCSVTL
jgi:hypothetical protein